MKLNSVVPGAILVSMVIVAAALSYVWTPFDVADLDIRNKMQTGSAEHWLGTDHLGRDVLSMLMVGARTSIAVALVAVIIGMGIGVPLGLFSAARRGTWIDEFIMRGNDLVFAFPALLIAIMITAVFGPGALNYRGLRRQCSQCHYRYWYIQYTGVCAFNTWRCLESLDAGIYPGGACSWQKCVANFIRAYTTQCQ